MTVNEYINNPYGKGSAFANRKIIYDALRNRYIKLLEKHKVFSTYVYKSKNGHYIHIKVPSESVDNVFYDVVIYLSGTSLVIKNLDMKVFSNCPSFTFTYAYVFNKNDMIIESLKDKLDDTFYKDDPVMRNPNLVLGYEKSILFASIYLLDKYMTIANLKRYSRPYNKHKLYTSIKDEQAILLTYQRGKKKQALKKKAEERKLFKAIKKEDKSGTINRIEGRDKIKANPNKKITPTIKRRDKIKAKKKI